MIDVIRNPNRWKGGRHLSGRMQHALAYLRRNAPASGWLVLRPDWCTRPSLQSLIDRGLVEIEQQGATVYVRLTQTLNPEHPNP